MKNFVLIPKLTDYRNYIREQVVAPEFGNHVFFQKLIEFVIQHRSPIFFKLSYDYEFSHFTQPYGFVLDREDYYKNRLVRAMYFMHDFMHMIFHNPMRVGHLSHKEFSYILTMNEFLASNETEILTYFRIPSMREHSLNYKTLYDLLREAGIDEKPSVSELLTLRLAILHGEKHPTISKIESLPGADEVLQFIRKFKNSNKLWCDLWYEHFPKSEFAHALFRYEDEPMTVPAIDYERFLMDYNPNGVYNNQDQYEQNVVRNVRTLVILTRSQYAPPRTLGECEQILTKMSAQNIVMMPEAAKAFHQKYLANKPIGVGAKK